MLVGPQASEGWGLGHVVISRLSPNHSITTRTPLRGPALTLAARRFRTVRHFRAPGGSGWLTGQPPGVP